MILIVKSYERPPLDFLRCVDEEGRCHNVDLMVNGDLPAQMNLEDLVGKIVEVDRLEPYEEIGYGVKILETQNYYFTFGSNHEHPNGYAVFSDITEDRAHLQMVEAFGQKWAFAYTEERWNEGGISQAQKWGLHQVN